MFPWYLLAFCRAVVGIAFAISFAGKARDIHAFAQAIERFDILPARSSIMAAWFFMSCELIVVILIIAGGKLLLPGFLIATSLLLVFSSALAWALHRKIQTSCNCFGSSEKPVTPYDIWRNAGFILCSLGGCGTIAMPIAGQSSLNAVEFAVAALGAAVFVAVSAQLGEIAQLFKTS